MDNNPSEPLGPITGALGPTDMVGGRWIEVQRLAQVGPHEPRFTKGVCMLLRITAFYLGPEF